MNKCYTSILLFLCINIYYVNAQCANTANIYRFDYNGHTYEVVKENKNWADAVACAVARGGYLAEIDTAAENTAIFDELLNNASITLSLTSTANGGGAAYVWLGGNDRASEGTWIWDTIIQECLAHFCLVQLLDLLQTPPIPIGELRAEHKMNLIIIWVIKMDLP